MSNDQEIKDRIIQAAGPLFLEKGFQGTTVRQICETAKVNIAAINYHFGDKQKLYEHLLISKIEDAQSRFPLPFQCQELSPAEQLLKFNVMFLQRILSEPKFAWQKPLIMREMTRPASPFHKILFEHTIKNELSLLKGIIKKLANKNMKASDIDALIFSNLGQLIFYKHAQPIIEMWQKNPKLTPALIKKTATRVTKFMLIILENYNHE